jgi:hypothetical protein
MQVLAFLVFAAMGWIALINDRLPEMALCLSLATLVYFFNPSQARDYDDYE